MYQKWCTQKQSLDVKFLGISRNLGKIEAYEIVVEMRV